MYKKLYTLQMKSIIDEHKFTRIVIENTNRISDFIIQVF